MALVRTPPPYHKFAPPKQLDVPKQPEDQPEILPPPPLTAQTVQAGPAKVVLKFSETQETKTLLKSTKPKEVTLDVPKKPEDQLETEESSPPVKYQSRITEAKACLQKTKTQPLSSKNREYPDRVTEARACIKKAKTALGESRNLRSDIKTDVTQAVDRLFQLVKEAENAKLTSINTDNSKETENLQTEQIVQEENSKGKEGHLTQIIEQHAKLLQENNLKMEELKKELETGRKIVENRATYASVAATVPKNFAPEHTALHSIAVSSIDQLETGDEVIEKIRRAVNAKDGFITVDRVRKARDRKVIVGCKTQEERQKVKERLSVEGNLLVEEMKNKDPLIALKNVFNYNTDEDILSAINKQNADLFKDLKSEEDRVEIAYRRKTRNPHTSHVILRVSPQLWNRTLHKGAIHIDIQRVKVEDQSPLVQCTCCLAYGHSKRFCKETIDKCSHCGGPHTRVQCPDWIAGAAPSCVNCTQAKHASTEHNAFSNECTVRRRWEAMARARVAYC